MLLRESLSSSISLNRELKIAGPMKQVLLLIGTIFFLSCAGGDTQGSKHVYWVNSTKKSCVGLAPTKCLQVQKSEKLDPSAWKSFHTSIKGFDYEPGYIYKLLIRERILDPATVPEDASSIEYTLVKILEKKEDIKLRINDTWVLVKLKEETLQPAKEGISAPLLEINVGEMSYMGKDGCNNFTGGIIELDEQRIRFGVAAGTRMMCQEMRIPDLFNITIPEVAGWEIIEEKLRLSDADGRELMQLKKSD